MVGDTPALVERQALALRVEEAARLLGISRAKMYRMLEAGEIGSIKIGRARRVPVEEVHAFIHRARAAG